MRTLCWWSVVGAATLALMGCSGSSAPTTPAENQAAGGSDYSVYATADHAVENAAGHFRMRVDLNTMSGDIIPVVDRQATLIGDQYNLPINQFFAAIGGGFELTTVGINGAGDVEVGYTISHPFGPPTNLAGPATAANRADLGVSGRVVFMTPAPTGLVDDETNALNEDDYQFTFGTTTITTNTKVVKNADGYFDPAGMVDLADFPAQNGANVWPFKSLVDESADPRTLTSSGAAITNGGASAGNYNAAAGGWQNVNIGASNADWAGYGVMHQGQTVANTVAFDPDLAEGGSFDLDFIVTCKYIDPRGGTTPTEKRGNRLPTGDATKFAYREPWGAQDLSKISAADLTLTGATAGNLDLDVVDFDFAAVEDAGFPTAGANLDQIPVGTAGIASVEVAGNDILTTNVVGGAATGGTGTDADPVTYSISIANGTATTGGVDNGAWVMVKLVDSEDTFVPTAPLLSLTLNKGNPPFPVGAGLEAHPVVYQAKFVDLL